MTFRDTILVLLLSALSSFADSLVPDPAPVLPAEFSVRVWGREQGLPDDTVTSVLQTRDGPLWVGTAAGLARFDGVKFTAISLPPARPDARVTALAEDTDGRLWIGTHEDGLFRLDREGIFRIGRAEGLLEDGVTSLAAGTDGALWIGTRHGLNRWDGRAMTAFTAREGLPDPLVSGIHAARSGAVWITTRGGMSRLEDGRIAPFALQTDSQGRSPEFLGAYEDRGGNVWAFGDTHLINLAEGSRFNYFRGTEATSVRIWSLCEGRDGRLWIGTSGRGLFWFDGRRFQPVSLGDERGPDDVRAMTEDREGNLWLGTANSGLTQLRRRPMNLLSLPDGARPSALAFDADGRALVGLESGGVVRHEAGRFEPLPGTDDRLRREEVGSVCVAPDGTIWVGTRGGGLFGLRHGRSVRFTTANGLSDDFVSALCVDAGGVVWAGTRAGLLHRITEGRVESVPLPADLPSQPVTSLAAARDGGVWIGTADGLVRGGGPERFRLVIETQAARGQPITALHEDAAGRLWVGTDGAGLICVQGRVWRAWTPEEGLPDSVVLGVISDASGSLWISTRKGLARVAAGVVEDALRGRAPLVVRTIHEKEGGVDTARPVEGWPRAWSAPDGKAWFALPQGVLVVETSGWEDNPPPPPVFIEQVLANGRALPLPGPGYSAEFKARNGSPVRLAPDARNLEIDFTAPHFADPGKLRFRHRLEGLDTDWVDAGPERRVRYTRLPHGTYRFQVTASAGDGVWHPRGALFSFEIPAPWWRSAWALGLYGAALVGAVAGTVRMVSHRRLRRRLTALEQQQAMERERMRIAQDMHDEIGSKLTRLSFLSERVRSEVPESDPVAAKIGSIAHTSRELLQTLDEIVWAVNPRNDSLEHLAAYLAQYATEYFQNTSVECDVRLPRSLPHHPLSAETRHNLFLAFEETLNNVLKHAAATHVAVTMAAGDGRFTVSVRDDGRGFDPEVAPEPAETVPRRVGNGLFNLRDRLRREGGRCDIRSRPGEGTTVVLEIPLPETRPETRS